MDLTLMIKKSIVVNLLPPNVAGFTLFPWEKTEILMSAEKMGLKVKILPSTGWFNRSDNVIAVNEYFFNHKKCPFLSDSKTCSIYKDRPLICRIYPIFYTGLIIKIPPVFSKACPNIPIKENFTLKVNMSEHFEIQYNMFGETFEWAEVINGRLRKSYYSSLLKNKKITDHFLLIALCLLLAVQECKEVAHVTIKEIANTFQDLGYRVSEYSIINLRDCKLKLKLSVPTPREIRKKGLENLLPSGIQPSTNKKKE